MPRDPHKSALLAGKSAREVFGIGEQRVPHAIDGFQELYRHSVHMRDGLETIFVGLPGKGVSRSEIGDGRRGWRQALKRFRDPEKSGFERMRVLRHGDAMLKAGITMRWGLEERPTMRYFTTGATPHCRSCELWASRYKTTMLAPARF